jgi:hypothetical protein
MPRRRKRRYKTGTHSSSKSGGECAYRSSWELIYMRYLDANPDVVSYEYEKVIVPYISNIRSGRIRKYFPDFLVTYSDGKRILVEIKPSNRVHNRIVMKKLLAADQWCKEHDATLDVVTEVELKQLKLM